MTKGALNVDKAIWELYEQIPHLLCEQPYGDKIRSMNDTELAEFLSQCVIPDDECKLMFIYGVGHFGWTDDLADKLGEQIEGDKK